MRDRMLCTVRFTVRVQACASPNTPPPPPVYILLYLMRREMKKYEKLGFGGENRISLNSGKGGNWVGFFSSILLGHKLLPFDQLSVQPEVIETRIVVCVCLWSLFLSFCEYLLGFLFLFSFLFCFSSRTPTSSGLFLCVYVV